MSFQTPFLLVNRNIENVYFRLVDDFFLTQIKSQKEKQSGNNADAVSNDFTALESESTWIMFDAIFLWIVPMMQF